MSDWPLGTPDSLSKVVNVEAAAYGVQPDDFYTDVAAIAGGTVTVVAATNLFTRTGHGLSAGSVVSFSTTGTLPAPLAVNTPYYVIASGLTANDFKVATTSGGTEIDITDTGTGTHTVIPALNSATANFTSADVGKVVMVLRGGPSSLQDHHTTITAVTGDGLNACMANTAGRTQANCRFYISRGGDQATGIQAAINACSALGGGIVYLPGVGYLTSTLTLKNRVRLVGSGQRSTIVHATHGLNAPVIMNDQTSQNSANMCQVESMWVDGARFRQSNVTTTLGANYTAGDLTVTVAATANLLNSGMLQFGTNRVRYEAIGSGTTVTSAQGGTEDTTDAASTSGATVTQNKNHGIYFAPVPFKTIGTTEEAFDPHWLIRDVHVKNCKGDGVSWWGQSEGRIDNVWASLNDEYGIRPSFDTWVDNCTADTNGRSGYHVWGSECHGTNSKAFTNGGVTAAAGFGFFFEGPASLEEGTKVWTACDAQDNKADGIYARTAQRVIFSGTASSNGTSSAGTYSGLKLDGAGLGIYDVVATERAASPTQQSGLNMLATALTPTQNMIRLTWGYSVTSGATPTNSAIKSGSVVTGDNDIIINGGRKGTIFSNEEFGSLAPASRAFAAINSMIFVAVIIQTTCVLTGVRYKKGTGTVAANVRVALYDVNGTRVANKTADFAAGTTASLLETVPFDATVIVSPGLYYIGIIGSSTSADFVGWAATNEYFGRATAATQGSFVTPASFTPPADTAVSSTVVPFVTTY